MQQITPDTDIPKILQDLKVAYDNKDYEGIANLFAKKAQFQGTNETEYREVLRGDIIDYFKKIGDDRKTQKIELVALQSIKIHEGDGQIVGVEAVFHSVASNGQDNPDKQIRIGMELDAHGEITKFKSEPREP